MATDITSVIGGGFGGWGSGMGTIILVIVLGALVAVLFWMVWNLLKYKYTFVIREINKGRKRVYLDKAKVYKEGGVEYWKLLKNKSVVPIPPSDAIEINHKGKFFVEAYKTPSGEFHYLVDKEKFDANDSSFEPFTTAQRALAFNQIKMAHERSRTSLLEKLMPLAPGLILVIVFVILIAFYGKIAEPFLKSQELQNANQEKINEALTIINQILDERQELPAQQNNNGGQFIPPS